MCGIVFANPMAEENELKEFYQGYYSKTGYQGRDEIGTMQKYFNNYSRRDMDLFIGYTKIDRADNFKKNYLDIGCGLGKNLFTPYKMDYDVYGTEYDVHAIKFILKNMPTARIFNDDLLAIDFKNIQFDYIMFYHVIEHLTNPQMYIKRIFELLKPNGKLFVGTVDIETVFYTTIRVGQKIFFQIPSIYDGIEHTYIFNKINLKKLLTDAGFIVEDQWNEPVIDLIDYRPENTIRRRVISLIERKCNVNQVVIARKTS